ncbi:MAG: hypothetical protein FD165_441 [Gammaproteobacteria bacterium]|nr:MAG: hypothetical protein FD165_441 [Gammaproteobacteria bacterium]TND02296.1 MAG: hypothetical protein FD120_2460 [Gammaproteobacteria bacterium]
MSVIAINPCLNCGACCAYYRISFYWTEAAPELGGTVPSEFTEQLTSTRAVMKGTHGGNPRCVCLAGAVGEPVHCTIYPQRPGACREFEYSWQNGQPNERCDKARVAHGLPPLPGPSPVTPDHPIAPEAA